MAVKFSNSAATTFSVAVLAGDSSVTVNDASEFPSVGGADYCYVTFSNSTDIEVVKVTAISGSVLTTTRAQESTSAAGFNIGDACQLRVTAGMLTDAFAEKEPVDATILKDADIASTVQAYDADLTAIAGITSAADKFPYFTGSATADVATVTAAARTVLDDVTVGAMLTTLGGQPLDADLTAIAGLTSAADKLPYFTGAGAAALATFSSFDRTSLLGHASEAALKAAINLETGVDVQAYDANNALLDVDQVWAGAQRATVTALTSATTISIDFSSSNDFSLTMAHDATLGEATGTEIAGQHGSIFITGNASGTPNTLGFHASYLWVGGTDGVLTATNSAKDTIDYRIRADGVVELSISKGLA